MMSHTQFYLAKIAEECSEIAVAAIDVLDNDFKSASLELLYPELDDLFAAVSELSKHGLPSTKSEECKYSFITRTEIMTALIRQSSAIGKIALKNQQFGLNEICPGQPYSNAERLVHELNLLMGIVNELKYHGFDFNSSTKRVAQKIEKMNYFREYSEELNQVQPQDCASLKT